MTANADEQLKELTTIRKLLILAMLRSGLTQDELGATLGMHGTTIGRMFPKGTLKAIGRKGATDAGS